MATAKELEAVARAARAEAEVSRLRRLDPAKEAARAVAAEAMVTELETQLAEARALKSRLDAALKADLDKLLAENADLARQVMAFQGGEAYELGVIHGSAGAGKEIDRLRARVAELDELARDHYDESERTFDRAVIQRDRAEAAERVIALVRSVLVEHLGVGAVPRVVSDWEAGYERGIRELAAEVGALLPSVDEPASNSAVHLSVQVEATSGVASSPASRADL